MVLAAGGCAAPAMGTDGSLYPLSRLEEEKAIALSELGRDHEVAPRLRAQGAVWQTKFVAKEPHSVMTCFSSMTASTINWSIQISSLPLPVILI